jgi:hypothetical protein
MAYNDFSIVDNDASERSGRKYPGEWWAIYRQVVTSYFEICGLLNLDGKWQKLEKIKTTVLYH